MGVQALRPQTSVGGLDERIVRRFAEAGEVQRDVVGVGPEIQIARDELRALAERTRDALWNRIGSLIDLFSPTECANFFTTAGYEPD